MIGAMIDDVLDQTRRNVADCGQVGSAEDVRRLGRALVAFTPDMAEDLARLRQFLHVRMYRHYRVNRTPQPGAPHSGRDVQAVHGRAGGAADRMVRPRAQARTRPAGRGWSAITSPA